MILLLQFPAQRSLPPPYDPTAGADGKGGRAGRYRLKPEVEVSVMRKGSRLLLKQAMGRTGAKCIPKRGR